MRGAAGKTYLIQNRREGQIPVVLTGKSRRIHASHVSLTAGFKKRRNLDDQKVAYEY